MTIKRRPRRRGGRPKGRVEENFITIRGSQSILANHTNFEAVMNTELGDQILHGALKKQFGENKAETMATMRIGGYLEVFKKNLKFTATRKDMKRFFMLVEKNRIDKKFGLTKREATARFFSDKPYKKISKIRPKEYEARPDNIYRPRPGSSRGKIRVEQTGAVATEKALRQAMKSLFTILEGAFTPKGKVSKNVRIKK